MEVPAPREAEIREESIDLVTALSERYAITALRPFIESCRAAASRTELSVGVLGRFKAGKSSFLNRLTGRSLLPVGAIPVTAIVTDLAGGDADSAIVRFANGSQSAICVEELSQYVSESENPDNRKAVSSVSVRAPELRRFGGIRFFDTPGLESAFAHNTEASRQWAPNVDVALVAVAVDPPLSEHDIRLIRNLLQYTPRIALLLTKFDLLAPEDREPVLQFVRDQLRKNIDEPVDVFPYSIRPGYEHLIRSVEKDFLDRLRAQIGNERRAIVNRKIRTLLSECADYMRLTLKSAEMIDSERSQLRTLVTGEKDALADTKLELRLIARHAMGGCRGVIEKILSPEEVPVREQVLAALRNDATTFPGSLDRMIEAFQAWLDEALSSRLLELSRKNKSEFQRPLSDVQRQYHRVLQGFRDRLSARVMEIYGVPLRTTEPEIGAGPPKEPDVSIGRVFDHNWELLSPVLPMGILRPFVLRRFEQKVASETFKNLSRVTTQWQDIINEAILRLQTEAERRIEDLVATVDRLTSTTEAEAQHIRDDLDKLDALARE